MKMQSVTSSNIAEVGHEGTTLRIKFNIGSVYEYENVTAATFQALLTAESVGKYFAANIKKLPFKKIS